MMRQSVQSVEKPLAIDGQERFQLHQRELHVQTDRTFAWLMAFQWILGICLAIWVSPLTWKGASSEMHPHVLTAILLGGVIAGFPVILAIRVPGTLLSRHVIAIAQAFTSALLIHLCGGRIEAHFHIFGSLAFLKMYRDWPVLVTASVVIAVDHLVRGLLWPQSIYGILDPGVLRSLEHVGWVVFEDFFLILACLRGRAEMKKFAQNEAILRKTNQEIETKIEERTSQLATSEAKLRLLVEGMDVVAWEYDPALETFTYVSPQVERLGYPVDAWYVPGFWKSIIHKDDRLAVMDYCETQTQTRNDHRLQYRILKENGDIIWMDNLISLSTTEDGRPLLRGIMVDITDRKQLESNIIEATKAAFDANRSKSEFLANMSHEIRTPMTAILGFADLLLEEGETSEVVERRIDAALTIRRNGEHLLEIINDILDLSKIESGKLSVEVISCAPAAVVEEVLSLMRVRAHGKGLVLTAEYETLVPATIQTDPTRLRQILLNLIGNAIKFTEAGSVQLSVRLISGQTSFLEFDVIDTGIGLKDDQRESLFQPFSQADNSTTRKYGGTGLGLSICKRLAEMLKGDIAIVESTPGVGTRFQLSLEMGSLEGVLLCDPSQTGITSAPSKSSHDLRSSIGTLAGRKLLLVDDSPDNQRLISYVLTKAGADVTVVENGQLAVNAALQGVDAEDPFHTILMDMQMPVLDGYEATALLRARGYDGAIIALTANAMSGDREKCLAAGCDDFATKPINREKLIEQILSCDAYVRCHHADSI